MPYHHLAHADSFKSFVKKGKKISRGDQIGEVGFSGTRYPHTHYEVRKQKPDYWTQYVYDSTGKPYTEDQILQRYADPKQWIDRKKNIPAPYTTYGGWEFLDKINNLGAIHPGVDINRGSGFDDYRDQLKSPCDGEILYVGRNDGGWGNHVWIYEDDSNQFPQVDMSFAMKHTGKFFLQVEEHGEIWYVDPNGYKHFIGSTPQEMLKFVEKQAVGITNSDLDKFPTNE